ncbi:hypothetical protein Scep_009110 [Stephania cephalantha]|uniref:Uncharacterized protein n=1 Tax=Stephania cephalantha TaxID=152367 RepID=A0AAP0JT97_9MAGN
MIKQRQNRRSFRPHCSHFFESPLMATSTLSLVEENSRDNEFSFSTKQFLLTTRLARYAYYESQRISSVDENSERARVRMIRKDLMRNWVWGISLDQGVISSGSSVSIKVEEENRWSMGMFDLKPPIFPHHVDAELSAAGWPHWLIAVAGEAIRGLVPRRANDFEKLERVEQLLGIYELCGSPSEEYWNRSKLPYATLLKPQRPYKRCIAETFNNFPPSLLPLIETLLAIDPAECQSATAALMSELSGWCDVFLNARYQPEGGIVGVSAKFEAALIPFICLLSVLQFFTTEPFVPYPSNLLHISPSKEMDGIPCEAKARSKEAAVMKGQKSKGISAPDGNAESGGVHDMQILSWQSQAVEETEKGQHEHYHNKASLFGPLTHQTRWTESSRNWDYAPNMSTGDKLSTLPSLAAATSLLADSSGAKPGSSQSVATKFVSRWFTGPFHEVSECNIKQEMKRQVQGYLSSNQDRDGSIDGRDQIPPGNDSKVNEIFYGGPLFTPSSNLDKLLKKYSPLFKSLPGKHGLGDRLRKSKLDEA